MGLILMEQEMHITNQNRQEKDMQKQKNPYLSYCRIFYRSQR